MSDRLKSIQDKESTAYRTYSELTSELESLVLATGIDPIKFLDYVTIDKDYQEEIVKIKNDAAKIRQVGDNTVIKSIVDSALSFELMKKMMTDAGGEKELLGYLMRRYNIAENDIGLNKDALDIQTKRVSDLEVFKKSFREGLNDLGLTEEEVFFPLMVQDTGIVITAESAGRIVGILDLFYDRSGWGFIHTISTSKYRVGLDIPSRLLIEAENHCTKPRIWSAIETSNIGLVKTFLKNGYRIRRIQNDFYGPESRVFIVIKTKDDQSTGGMDEISSKVGGEIPILVEPEDPTTTYAIPLASFLSNPEKYQESYDGVMIVKSSEGEELIILKPADPLHVRQPVQLPVDEDAGNYKICILDTPDQILEIHKIEKNAFGDYAESLQNLMMLSKVGLFLGIIDNETQAIAAVSEFIFDGSDGIYIYGTAVKPGYIREKIRRLIHDRVDEILEFFNRKRIFLSLMPEDIIAASSTLNQYNYKGKFMILDFFGKGHHRLICERTRGDEREKYEYHDARYIKSYMEYNPSNKNMLVDINNYGLIKTILAEGYELVCIVPRNWNKKEFEVDKELYLMVKE